MVATHLVVVVVEGGPHNPTASLQLATLMKWREYVGLPSGYAWLALDANIGRSVACFGWLGRFGWLVGWLAGWLVWLVGWLGLWSGYFVLVQAVGRTKDHRI